MTQSNTNKIWSCKETFGKAVLQLLIWIMTLDILQQQIQEAHGYVNPAVKAKHKEIESKVNNQHRWLI